MSSKRYSSLLLTALFVSSTTAAMAGSKSMLDPYCAVQAPPSKKPKAAKPLNHDITESTHTTYISMPIPSEDKQAGGGGGKKFGLFGGPKAEKPKAPKQVAEKSQSDEPGIAAKSIESVKNAGSSVVEGSKAAGSKIVEGSKVVGGGIASGTKKIGGGIASGAKASGGFMMKGVSAIGHGFKSTGEKVKDGAGAAGGKVAGLPKLWGKKGDDQEKAKQQAIAKALAEKKAGKTVEQPQAAKDIAADPNSDDAWNNATASETTPAEGTNSVTSNVPVQVAPAKVTPMQSFKTANTAPKGQGKLAGITGGFGKAFGKLNPFGSKNPTMIQPVVRPQSTAAGQSAIPQ
ncbi:MAG: hypothetical protein C0507_15590 [Cyanobacteria bacterium PR.3.49]|jgi:hypothetical protein|nr:hypothetical protein [Cyanobacteria bacterium PR.3.49]